MSNERKPTGIVFYALTLRNASMLPDAELGQVVKAVWRFYDTGALPEGFDMAQGIVFDMFRVKAMPGGIGNQYVAVPAKQMPHQSA